MTILYKEKEIKGKARLAFCRQLRSMKLSQSTWMKCRCLCHRHSRGPMVRSLPPPCATFSPASGKALIYIVATCTRSFYKMHNITIKGFD